MTYASVRKSSEETADSITNKEVLGIDLAMFGQVEVLLRNEHALCFRFSDVLGAVFW